MFTGLHIINMLVDLTIKTRQKTNQEQDAQVNTESDLFCNM